MHALKLGLALCSLAGLPVWAAPAATVAAVQSPAWLERAGRVQPLAVGMEIRNGDRVRTGEDGRAQLALAEGSSVKLGAVARLAFFNMSDKPRTQFKGALDVVSGAFRFTTDALKRVKSRDVAIRVGTATAGIRGTDVWGRSNAQEDLVCLIEGKIEIWHAELPAPLSMSKPMTFFVAPKGQAPKPVAAVNAEEFRQWAQQTEIAPGAGFSRKGGKVALDLGRYANEQEALGQYDLVRSAGFAATVRPLPSASGGWDYQLVVAGFPNGEEAAAAAQRLKAATGVEAATAR